jgi:hypothetical protein
MLSVWHKQNNLYNDCIKWQCMNSSLRNYHVLWQQEPATFDPFSFLGNIYISTSIILMISESRLVDIVPTFWRFLNTNTKQFRFVSKCMILFLHVSYCRIKFLLKFTLSRKLYTVLSLLIHVLKPKFEVTKESVFKLWNLDIWI